MSADITRDAAGESGPIREPDLTNVSGDSTTRLHVPPPADTEHFGWFKSDAIVELIAQRYLAKHPAKAFRALLTDECDYPGCQSGEIETLGPDHTDPCPKCDGRGWLPKDGVLYADWNFGDTDDALAIRVDWLEAEHE